MLNRSGLCSLVSVLVLGTASVVSAAALTWDPGTTQSSGGNGTWNTASWWNGAADAAWVTNNDAIFTGAAGSVTLSVATTANTLTFNTAGYTIAANTLTISGGSVNMAASSGTISSIIAGAAGLIKTGTGNLWTSGLNTVTGGVTVKTGTLTINATSGGNGEFAGSAITVASGAELDVNAGDGTGYSVGNALTISGVMKKLNAQSETFNRPTTLSGGTITSSNGAAVGGGLEAYNFFGNYIATAPGTSNLITGVGQFGLRTATAYFNTVPNSTLTISTPVRQDQNGANTPLLKQNTGLMVLAASNTYTGKTNIFAGTLSLTGSASIGSTSAISLAPGVLFDLSGLNSTFTLGAAQSLSGGRVGTLGTDVNGSLISSGTLAAQGTLSINGSLSLNNGSKLSPSLAPSTSALITVNGAGSTLTLTGTTTVQPFMLTNGTFTLINGYSALAGAGTVSFGSSALGNANFRGVPVGSVSVSASAVTTTISGMTPLSVTWVGNATNGWDVNTNANWNNGVGADKFFHADTVTFDDTSGTKNVNISASVYPAAVTVNNTLTYTFSGAGALSGPATLTKSNTGRLAIYNANTFYGGTTISAGEISLGNAGNENANGLGTGPVTVTGSSLLHAAPGSSNTNFFIPNNITLSNGAFYGEDGVQHLTGTVNITGGTGAFFTSYSNKDTFLDGVVSGTGAVTIDARINPQGIVYFNNPANSYSGTLTENANGFFGITSNTALQNATVIINGRGTSFGTGVTTPIYGAFGGSTSIGIPTGGTLTAGGNNASTVYSGLLSGSAVFAKVGSGVQAFTTGANSYSGGTVVTGGELALGNGANENASGLGSGPATFTNSRLHMAPGSTGNAFNIANNITVNSGSVYGEDGNQHLTGTVTVGGTGATFLTSWTGKNLYLDGPLVGNVPLTIDTVINAQGAVHLTSTASAYSGTATINPNGLLAVDNDTVLQTSTLIDNGTSAGQGAAFTSANPVVGSFSGPGFVALSNGANLSVNSLNTTTTYSGVMSGSGGLTKAGSGTLTLSNLNTYTGSTVVNGTVVLGTGGVGGTIGASAITVNSGATLLTAVGDATGYLSTSSLTLSGGTLAKGAGNLHETLARPVTLNNGTIASIDTGDVAGTFPGQVYNLFGNTITTTSATSNFITLPAGGKVLLRQNGATYPSFNLGTGSTLTVNAIVGDWDNNGVNGLDPLNVSGAGTMILNGSNGYSGGTTLTSGTLQANSPSALGLPTGPLAINSGLLDLHGNSAGGAAFSGAGTIDNLVASTTATLTVGNADGGGTFSGSIRSSAGVINLAKTGNGTIVLTGNNTYTGATTSNNGALIVTGSHTGGGAYTINGGTLAGRATITAPVTMANGTTLSVGNKFAGISGAGLLSVGGLDLTAGAINAVFSLTSTASVPGNDKVAVNGALSLAGASTITVVKLGTALQSASYPLFTYSSLSGTPSNVFTLSPGALTSRQSSTISTSANTVWLNVIGSVQNLIWNGTGSNTWDNVNTNLTWTNNVPAPDIFVLADNVAFTNAASQTAVTLADTVAPSSVTISGSQSYTFGGASNITGLTGVTINSTGVTTFANNFNDYSGGTTVTSGTLALGVNNVLPTAGVVTLGGSGSAGVLDLAGFNQQIASLGVGSGATAAAQIVGNSSATPATLTLSGGSTTFSGTIKDTLGSGSQNVGLTVTSSASAILTGANTFTGATTIDSGSLLQIGNGGSGATFAALSGQTVNLNGTLAFNHADALTVGGYISGNGSLVKQGSGILTLTGNNTYIGGTSVQNGTLVVGSASALSPSGTVSLGSVGTTGTLDLAGQSVPVGGLVLGTGAGASGVVGNSSLSTASTLSYSGGSSDFGGTIRDSVGGGSQTVALNVQNGTLFLTGSNTYSGGTTISGGILAIGNSGTTGSIPGNIANVARLRYDRTDTTTFAQTITGGGGDSVVVDRGGTLVLASGANVSANQLEVGNSTDGAGFGNGNLTVQAGATVNAATFLIGGQGGSSGAVSQTGGTVAVSGAGDGFHIGNFVGGTSSYTLAGGSLGVPNENMNVGWDGVGVYTQTGGTATVLGLRLGDTTTSPAGNTFTLNGGLFTTNGITKSTNNPVNFNLGGGTLQAGTTFTYGGTMSLTGAVSNATIDTQANQITLNGVIGGTGGLLKIGSGILQLGAFNTFTGGTVVNGGSLYLAAGGNGSGNVRGTLTISPSATASIRVHDVFGYNNAATTLSTLNINYGTLDQAFAGNETVTGVTINMTGGTISNSAVGGYYDLFANGTPYGSPSINSLPSATTSLISSRLNFRSYTAPFNVSAGTTASGVDLLLSGQLTGAFGFTKSGAGFMLISGVGNSFNINNNASQSSITGGTVQMGAALALGNGTNGLAVSPGALLDMNGFNLDIGLLGGGGVVDNVAGSGSLAFSVGNGNGSGSFSGSIKNTTGITSLTKNGTGTEVLSGTNTFGGPLAINNAGFINFAGAYSLGNGTAISFNGGGLIYGASNTYDITQRSLTIAVSGAVINTGGNNVTFANSFGGVGNFTKTGSGQLAISGSAESFNGLTLSGGTLQFQGNSTTNLISAASPFVVTNSGTLVIQDNATLNEPAFIKLGGAAGSPGNVVQTGGSFVITGFDAAAGNRALAIAEYPTETSSYTLTNGFLSVLNGVTYVPWNGGAIFTISGGTADLKSINFGAGIASNLTLNGSGALYIGTGGIVLGANNTAFNLNGGTLGALGSWSTTTSANLGGAATIDTAGNSITLTGSLSGVGSLTKVNPGILILGGTNANIYSGGTTVSGGTLQLAKATALGSGGLTVNGGSVEVAGFSPTVASLSGVGGLIINGGTANSTLTVSEAVAATTYFGTISDGPTNTLALLKSGTGTLVLDGADTFTGGTTINNGTLTLAANNAIADGTSLTVGSGGTLIFDVAGGAPAAVASSQAAASQGAPSIAAVPEPGTLALLAAALGGAVAYRSVRLRRNKK